MKVDMPTVYIRVQLGTSQGVVEAAVYEGNSVHHALPSIIHRATPASFPRRPKRSPAPSPDTTPDQPRATLSLSRARARGAHELLALGKWSAAGGRGIETLTARTAFVCSSTVMLTMHSECSHTETRGSGKGKSKVKVATTTAKTN